MIVKVRANLIFMKTKTIKLYYENY